MRNPIILFSVLAANVTVHASAEVANFRDHTVKMSCGRAHYTLTSTCRKSPDLSQLNTCRPQTLRIELEGATRSVVLPEFSRKERDRIRTSGGELGELFVVAWSCTKSSKGPFGTLYYSIGGGSAPYSEALSHYDASGRLIVSDSALKPDDLSEAMKHVREVPSIMPTE